jgi:zinc D-Ala-D-Ala dipeptidase
MASFFKAGLTISVLLIFSSCDEKGKSSSAGDLVKVCEQKIIQDTVQEPEPRLQRTRHYDDSAFINLSEISPDFLYDLKYATEDNFLKEKVYECDECYLRYSIALALIKANEQLLKKGYRLKLYDCYRPLSVQKKMWEIKPDKNYVANPYTSGSQHNRGVAVDLTIVDSTGKELDMGTPFDYFGIESHYNHQNLKDEVKANRLLLRNTMEHAGFKGIKTEWWHFSLGYYSVSDKILCEENK